MDTYIGIIIQDEREHKANNGFNIYWLKVSLDHVIKIVIEQVETLSAFLPSSLSEKVYSNSEVISQLTHTTQHLKCNKPSDEVNGISAPMP